MSADLKAAWERAESAEHRLKQLETSLRRLMRLLRPRPQDPDRKLIGFRVVRKHPKTREREYLPVRHTKGMLMPPLPWSKEPSRPTDRAWAKVWGERVKGRVVAVYLRVVKR